MLLGSTPLPAIREDIPDPILIRIHDDPIPDFRISENPFYRSPRISVGDAVLWIRPKDHRVVGTCLANARKSVNVTQDELAALLGKPQSLVSAYERGQRRLDLLEFLLVMDALKLDPHAVLKDVANSAEEIVKRASRKPKKSRSSA